MLARPGQAVRACPRPQRGAFQQQDPVGASTSYGHKDGWCFGSSGSGFTGCARRRGRGRRTSSSVSEARGWRGPRMQKRCAMKIRAVLGRGPGGSRASVTLGLQVRWQDFHVDIEADDKLAEATRYEMGGSPGAQRLPTAVWEEAWASRPALEDLAQIESRDKRALTQSKTHWQAVPFGCCPSRLVGVHWQSRWAES